MKKRALTLTIAVVLLLCLVLSGCSSASRKLIGAWSSSQGIVYYLLKDGEGYVQLSGFGNMQVPVTYTYKDDILTIIYGEDNEQQFGVTFNGDDQMTLENPVGSGTYSVYTRQAEQSGQ